MADRVKYFLLGLLFLVVAGVIAYDRWNAAGDPAQVAEDEADDDDRWEFVVGPPKPSPAGRGMAERELAVGPDRPEPPAPKPEPAKPAPKPEPVTPKPEPVAPPTPPPAQRIHVVKSGETLEGIALRYYQTRRGIAWIVAANRLSDPNRIGVNDKLIIPARKELQATPRAEPVSPRRVPERYRVKAGDGDLYAICRRFYGSKGEGARVALVMELNKLYSADVKPGTVLQLPPK